MNNKKIFIKQYNNQNSNKTLLLETSYIKSLNNLFNLNNNNLSRDRIFYELADFLTDEYQLITLSKMDFLLNPIKLHLKKHCKKSGFYINFNSIIAQIKRILVPIPNDITFNNYIYKFYQYYTMFDIFDNKKNILLIKPVTKLNIYNRNFYLYNTIENYLNHKKINTLTLFDNYENIELEKNRIKNFNKLKYKLLNNNQKININNTFDMVYIKIYKIQNIKNNIKNELKSIKKFINNMNKSLKYLHSNGDLLIELSYLPKSSLFKEILYYLSILFDEIDFMKSELYNKDINSGIFLCKKYKKEYEKINIEDGEYIRSILKKDTIIKPDFSRYINELYKELEEMNRVHEEEIKFYKKEQQRSLSTWNRFLRNHLIKNGIDWCKRHDIIINSIYNDFEDKLPNGLKYSLFPNEKGIDINKVKLTYESTFSVTRPKESDKITKIIRSFYPKAKTIVDCTANIGGNTIDFAKEFKNVISIEIDLMTYEALKNNVKLYKRDNVKVIMGDYTKLKNKMKGDVYFFDPPWGGIFYRMHNNLDMYLSGINIIDILPENFVMKAPINYNIEGLMKRFGNIVIYYITNFILIVNMTSKMKIEDTSQIMGLLENYKPLSDNDIGKYEDEQYEDMFNFFNTLSKLT